MRPATRAYLSSCAVHVIRDVGALCGALLVLAAAWSVIATVVVPRRVRSTLVRVVSIGVDEVFHVISDMFDTYQAQNRVLALQAPIALILQLVMWLAVFEVGFGLMLWRFAAAAGLGGALEQAGSSLCTLGFIAPQSSWPAALDDLAGLAGLTTVALQIGYLPTIYAAFNRRETLITMLDSRAGVPSWGPELLARTHYGLGTGVSAVSELPRLFEQWESWSADVAESHMTYITLVAFRSPEPLSSWVTAQLAVLDAAALYLSLLADPPGAVSARLCLRGGFTCLTTIAQAKGFDVPSEADPNDGITLTYDEFMEALERLRKVGFPIERASDAAWADFVGWRVNYEKAAYALARVVDAPPAMWSGTRRHPVDAMSPLRPRTRRAARK